MNVHKNPSHPPARSRPLSRTGLASVEFYNPSLLFLLGLCTLESAVSAQDKPQTTPQPNPPAATSEASAGLLPIPDYSGDFLSRKYLSGDWGGVRTDLANKGVQFGVDWNQTLQGITDGGLDRTTTYGGSIDYKLNLDLMRMGVLQGALIKFRAETRYGRSVNSFVPSLPVNTDAFFPLTDELDDDIPITITDLNYTQFLSPHFGVLIGKIDTLDGDPNEFASGRGTSQFMNANFLFNLSMALRFPYSTLAGGVVWMPVPPGKNGGITVSSIVMNTADSSTTSGFDDFDKGTSWTTEADFQYRLGHLPGGMNVGFLYSFNQDFAALKSRLIFEPGQGLSIPEENSTWAAYWSAWQYLFVEDPSDLPIDLSNGTPDHQGAGLFARFGVADEDTNPVKWAVSSGVGGRGVIPSRDNDTFGLGYFYNKFQSLRVLNPLRLEDSAQGFEAFYNIAVTPAFHVTMDVQVVEPMAADVHTATVLGLRAGISF